MKFDVTLTPDGLFHVQNYISFYAGQHHVHTGKGFDNWRRGLSDTERSEVSVHPGTCGCELKAGDVREYTGNTWHKEDFE